MNELTDTFSNRLSKIIAIRNIKPIELAEKTGISKSKISSYMSGRYKAKQDGIYILSKVLDVDPAWLMGYNVPIQRNIDNEDDSLELANTMIINVYVSISEINKQVLSKIPVSQNVLLKDKEYFGLQLHDDNMIPQYLPNDILIIEKTSDFQNGSDCILMISEETGTLRKVFRTDTGITLQSLNPIYPTLVYTNEQVKSLPVVVLGRVVELRRKILKG